MCGQHERILRAVIFPGQPGAPFRHHFSALDERVLKFTAKAVLLAKQPYRSIGRQVFDLVVPCDAGQTGRLLLPCLRDGLELRAHVFRRFARQHDQHLFRAEHLGQGGGDLCAIQAPEQIELGIHINAQRLRVERKVQFGTLVLHFDRARICSVLPGQSDCNRQGQLIGGSRLGLLDIDGQIIARLGP